MQKYFQEAKIFFSKTVTNKRVRINLHQKFEQKLCIAKRGGLAG